jgi:carnitine O-acetyltransferase
MAAKTKPAGITFAAQDDLPKLPIPDLDHTCRKYLAALKPLQGQREHAETKLAVHDFLKHDGQELQDKLKSYAQGKTSYIEQFCKSASRLAMVVEVCGLCSNQGTTRI